MTHEQPESPADPRLLDTLREDFRHVGYDFRQRGWHGTAGRTLTELEAFYLSTHAKQRLSEMHVIQRWAVLLWWLLKSLLLKLTPARRVLLAVSLILLVTGIQTVRFGVNEVSFRFPLIGTILLLLVLMLELKDKLLARDELEAGRKVQLALMPERSPELPGWDLWLFTRPANDVGGDLVDFLRIDAGRVGVSLGDVAGKALPAALLMAKLQATLRALVPQFTALEEMGAAVNRILCRDGLPNRFATLAYLEVTATTGAIRVMNAGHMPPLVIRGRSIEELPPGSMALGIVADATFAEQHTELANGDCLFVYSDGITEAMNATGDFFGDDRLRSLLHESAGRPAAEMGARVLAAVESFVGGARPHDDISMAVLRRTP
jgi:sigma-B regulation protein RsbU (phosphoserine phosphatase)